MWGVSVPLAWLLGAYAGLGIFGVWMGMALDEFCRGGLMFARWKGGHWRKCESLPPSCDTASLACVLKHE